MTNKWEPLKYPGSTFSLYEEEVLPMTAFKQWREYSQTEPDDVLVTIEYCSDCDHHDWFVHHDSDQYLKVR